jgi:hypothetical protein
MHLLCEIFNTTIFHAIRHAVLNTCGLQSLFCPRCTEDAQLCRKREIGEVSLSLGKLLHLFNDIHAAHAGFPAILLATGNLTSIAPCAVFIVYQKPVF